MTSIDPIRDIRFEGMDIPQLQEWIAQIKQGRGTESMQSAVRALDECVKVVVELDETLRRELAKLQINWEGNAGSIAAEATQQQSAFFADLPDPLHATASSVDTQGQSYDHARNTLPSSDELRHQESENVLEYVGGGFGYESDYDQEAKDIAGQRQAAQAALASYRDTSVQQAESYQPLPTMPAAAVSTQSPTSSPVGNAGISPGTGDLSGGGQPSTGQAPGTGVAPGVGVVPGKVPPGPGIGDRLNPPDKPGGDDEHAGEVDLGGDNPEAADTGDGGLSTGTILGIAAGGAAAVGIGGYAASKMLGKSGTPATAGGPTTGGSGGEPKSGTTPRSGGTSKIGGGPGDTVAGKTAGNTPGSRPGPGSILSPAATRGEKRAEDDEHENKYVADETHFDDERLVAPAVLGNSGSAADDEPEIDEEDLDALMPDPTASDSVTDDAGDPGGEPKKQD